MKEGRRPRGAKHLPFRPSGLQYSQRAAPRTDGAEDIPQRDGYSGPLSVRERSPPKWGSCSTVLRVVVALVDAYPALCVGRSRTCVTWARLWRDYSEGERCTQTVGKVQGSRSKVAREGGYNRRAVDCTAKVSDGLRDHPTKV